MLPLGNWHLSKLGQHGWEVHQVKAVIESGGKPKSPLDLTKFCEMDVRGSASGLEDIVRGTLWKIYEQQSHGRTWLPGPVLWFALDQRRISIWLRTCRTFGVF